MGTPILIPADFIETTASSVDTPPAGYVSLFAEGGALKQKDSTGAVVDLVKWAGGSDGYIQYNDAGNLSGEAEFTYNKSSNILLLRGKYEVIKNNAVPASLTNPTVQATNDVNNYTQISIQNKNTGASSSSDLIAYADNVSASDLSGFIDAGITSSGFNDIGYIITKPNDSYIFGSAPSGSGSNGDLIIATDHTGTTNRIIFYTNGFDNLANERFQITDNGIIVVGTSPTIRAEGSGADIDLDLLAKGAGIVTVGGVQIATVADLATKQASIQFKDDGTSIGTAGAVSIVNFTGAGVTATHSAGVITVNIPLGGGGGITINQVTLDFGVKAVAEYVFTVTDALCSPATRITFYLSGIGDSRQNDEFEFAQITCTAIPGTGTFDVYCITNDAVHGNYVFNYFLT